MPLIKSRSKPAFKKNLKTELAAGKPMDQSLAISYAVKRKAAHKKMAEGGEVSISAKAEKRPMPNDRHGDSDETRRNSGDKASKNDNWLDNPGVAAAKKPSLVRLSQPKMVESGVIRAKLRSDEHDLMMKDAPASPKEQPSKILDEKGAKRQGPESKDLHMKMMAKGGEINKLISMSRAEEDEVEHPAGLEEDNDQRTLPVDEYMAGHFAEGGHIGESQDNYADDGHEDSIAAAIMARRERLHAEIDSGAHDEDHAAMMAEGGSLPTHPEDADLAEGEVDIDDNERELPNSYYKRNEDYTLKENYDEDFMDESQPEDSNEHGDEHEKSEEDEHDMISKIRSEMNKRRQFKQR